MRKGCDTPIEYVESKDIIENTCRLANRIAKMQKHSVLVVCHIETHPETLKKIGIYDGLVKYMRDLVGRYPDLEFAIENSHHFKTEGESLRFRDMNYMASVILAKDVNHPRVGTCVDICHALMEMRFVKHILGYLEGIELDGTEKLYEKGLSAYFKANKGVIKLIHLATARTHGIGYDHGMFFAKEDKEFLKGIIDLYEIYGYEGTPITIEVKEDDYTNCLNFDITNKLLREVLKERK